MSSKVKNSLTAKIKTVFMDSVKKSYFSLRTGFASVYQYTDHNLARSGDSVMAEYKNTKNGAATLFSSYELANAVIVNTDEVAKLAIVDKWDNIYTEDVVTAPTLASEVNNRSLLPIEIRVLGALVTKSKDYDGYNSKISRGLIGYSSVKRYLNKKNDDSRHYNYSQYLQGIVEMGEEFKFNKVGGSWFSPGFLDDQANLNSTKLFVTVKWS